MNKLSPSEIRYNPSKNSSQSFSKSNNVNKKHDQKLGMIDWIKFIVGVVPILAIAGAADWFFWLAIQHIHKSFITTIYDSGMGLLLFFWIAFLMYRLSHLIASRAVKETLRKVDCRFGETKKKLNVLSELIHQNKLN